MEVGNIFPRTPKNPYPFARREKGKERVSRCLITTLGMINCQHFNHGRAALRSLNSQTQDVHPAFLEMAITLKLSDSGFFWIIPCMTLAASCYKSKKEYSQTQLKKHTMLACPWAKVMKMEFGLSRVKKSPEIFLCKN